MQSRSRMLMMRREQDQALASLNLEKLSSYDTEGKTKTHANPGLQPDALLSDRFKIIRFIAEGGIDEVYEAEDLELRERVAVKTIRAEVAREKGASERFRREIQLARKVTHPNVCQIFDIYHHRTALGQGLGGAGGEILFLSMELLKGETLQERIQRMGRLAPSDILPL